MACSSDGVLIYCKLFSPFSAWACCNKFTKFLCFCSSCSKIALCLLSSIVPQLFYSLNNDKEAVVISAAQSQISKFVLSIHLVINHK